MNYAKTIRDPMYGYITIEAPFAQLLDTEEFQRLRNIRQTGYQSLYPSALHNRFVHSLGVFHLGKKPWAILKIILIFKMKLFPVGMRFVTHF